LAADAWANLSLLRHEQGRPAEALALQRQALAIKVRLFAGQPARLARERFRHAMMLWQPLGDLGAAEPELHQAWQEMQEAAGPDHVDSALIEQQWGLVQLYLGDEAGAMKLLTHSRGVLEREAGRIDPDHLLSARLYLVECHLQAGRFDRAAPLLASAREELLGRAGEGSVAWHRYADLQQVELWSQIGEDARALELLASWRERLAPRGGGAPNPDLIDLMQREADVHQSAGRPSRALMVLDDLSRQVQRRPLPAELSARRCSVLLDLNRAAEALPLCKAKFDEVQARPARLRLQTENIAAHQRLARAWVATGQPQRALPLFEQARPLYGEVGDDHLYFAALRAHHGHALAATGQWAAARREIDLAVATMRRQPQLGPAWWLAVRDAESLLSRSSDAMS
jgi:tetratricopeptide (TPR) repeat protein